MNTVLDGMILVLFPAEPLSFSHLIPLQYIAFGNNLSDMRTAIIRLISHIAPRYSLLLLQN